MKTVILNKSNIKASPLVAFESIYDMTPLLASSIDVGPWVYNNTEIELPYSINRLDGQTSNYVKGTFTFTSSITIHKLQPTHLWFEHADQSAEILLNDVLVTKHWGGYNSFTVDITDFIKVGTNILTVKLKNNEGNVLAPYTADFNFNATLGKVKMLTSPVLPDIKYGYDGFHITSNVTDESATITIETSVPNYADVICHIDDADFHYSERKFGKGEITFTTIVDNPHLWDGKNDPHLYNVTLEICYNDELCHRLSRGYGFRYYSYVWDETIDGLDSPYTGFLLNGHPYLLRGVCMHNDLYGKANALTTAEMDNDFDILMELGVTVIRTAHYPHPKQFYDYCDKLGIVVQTEVPCVNNIQATMPDAYYEHLRGQYTDMVNEHYNHPSILFWGLSNEAKTGDLKDGDNNVIITGKEFARQKCNEYTTLIKSLDSERWVGYVCHQGAGNPAQYFGNPDCDWFGGNIYVGWYDSTTSNTPTSQLTSRLNYANTIQKPFAYSEYGCGGTQDCHTDDISTTNKGSGGARHDIEHMMWLHEGHIATIKQFPQILFSTDWVMFDFAVSNRNEGYTLCYDGTTTTTDDTLRRLNDKGLVMRDHKTKKDTFYLYKAWLNTEDKFVHICQKSFTKKTDRVIKCYTNETNQFSLYVNPTGEEDTPIETLSATDNIILFTAYTFNPGDVIVVTNGTVEDTFTFEGETVEEPEE